MRKFVMGHVFIHRIAAGHAAARRVTKGNIA